MTSIKATKTTTPARKRAIAKLNTVAVFQTAFVDDLLTAFGESLLVYLWSFKDQPLPGSEISNMWEWWREAAEAEHIKVRRPSYIFGVLKYLRREASNNGGFGGIIDKKAAITVAFKFMEAADDAGFLVPAVQHLLLSDSSLALEEAQELPIPERPSNRRERKPVASVVMVGGIPHHATSVGGQLVLGEPVESQKPKRVSAKKTAAKKQTTAKPRRLAKP